MIDDEELDQLCEAVASAAIVGEKALNEFGPRSQELKAIEEMGELLTAMARRSNGLGGVSASEVTDECADVIITALQIGMMSDRKPGYGPTDLTNSLTRKTQKLRDHIANRKAQSDVLLRRQQREIDPSMGPARKRV